jgi:voltage-gated potassium channel
MSAYPELTVNEDREVTAKPLAYLDPLRLVKISAVLLLTLTIVSTCIYYILGCYYGMGWTVMQCLFMVVITLTTIGYGDWLGLRSDMYLAMFYTMFLAMAGIGVPAFIISTMTALIVEGAMGDTVRRRRMHHAIQKLSGHIIVCGAGGTGEHCIIELLKIKRPFVVIDRDPERLKILSAEYGDFLYIIGSADRDEMLEDAGIKRAFGLIACLTDDKDNLFITLTGKVLNPELRVISKGIDDNVRKKMVIAGANAIVSPNAIGGLRMVSEMVRPVTTSFLDTMLRDRSGMRFGELTVTAHSALCNKTLSQADLRLHADVLIVAARHPGVEQFIYNPKADFKLESGCVIIVLGSTADIEKLRVIFAGGAGSGENQGALRTRIDPATTDPAGV